MGSLDGLQLSVYFRTSFGLTTGSIGQTAAIWRSDGTVSHCAPDTLPCSLSQADNTFHNERTFAARFQFDGDSLHIGNFRIGLFNGADLSISHSHTGRVASIFRSDSTAHTRTSDTWATFPNTNEFFPAANLALMSTSLSTFDATGKPLQTQGVVFPEILDPHVVSSVLPSAHPTSSHMTISVYGTNAGMSDWSGRLRIGSTASPSTVWQSAQVVTCRAASGFAFGLSVTSSVLLNSGLLSGVFSYSRVDPNVSSSSLIPETGSISITATGMNFGTPNSSPFSKFSNTACQSGFWQSSSSLRSKVASRFSRWASVVNVVTVARSQSPPTLPMSLLIFQSAYVSHRERSCNTPSTGGAQALIFAQSLSIAAFSAQHRFTGSAVESTQWLSDSCIQLRTPGGVVLSATSVVLSVTGFSSMMMEAWALKFALSYDTPSPLIATSQRISNISISGSNFGPYLAVIPRMTSCPTAIYLPPKSVSQICSSSELAIRSAGLTVTEASVSISFEDPVRLDDVTVSMVSPQGAEFKLMQGKCYGALPCSKNAISMNFRILPSGQFTNVPLVSCTSSGNYVPDDVASLRSALVSQSAMGIWFLRVSTGSQSQNISSSSIFFKTASLEFRIANQPVSSLSWFSDSSVSMKAPGFLEVEGIGSSAGFGRSRTVTALSSGIVSPTSCSYDYPDPVLAGTVDTTLFSTSGSTKVLLAGRYFSNSNSNPRSRAGLSSCSVTRWLSDSMVTCNQTPFLGRIPNFALTVESSTVTKFFPSAFVPVLSIANVLSLSAATAASLIKIDGSGLGLWDSSLRMRHTNGMSAADASIWLSDTRILTKMYPFASNRPGISVSLNSVVNNVSLFKGPELRPSSISAYEKTNFPTTGSAVFGVFGAGFGLYSASLTVALDGLRCMESKWVSQSAVWCKTPSGYQSRLSSLPLVVSSTGSVVNGSGSALVFDAPTVNGSANVFSENSNVCFFNVSGCVAGRLLQLVHSSSGFGTFSYSQRPLMLVQGSETRQCDNSSWTSDSSVHCLFVGAVSPEFRDLQVIIATAAVFILNPFYIPAPPPMSNSTVHFRFFRNLIYPEGEDRRYREYGTTSGFEWRNSSLASDVQYSEVVTFSFLVFVRASQFFMDSKFSPIQTLISGSITVWNSADVTSLVLCDKTPFKNVSFVLDPRLFWSKATVSVAFCTPKHMNGQYLSFKSNVHVRNVNGNLYAVDVSPTFLVASSGSGSVSITKYPYPQVRAAKVYDDVLGFRYKYGTKLDESCENAGVSVLKFSVALVCEGRTSYFLSQLPKSAGLIESTQCFQNITGISFTVPAKFCQFNISVLNDEIVFRLSPEFEVVPGFAEVAVLVGAGPFCASAGAIVWSMNSSSDGPCLVAQLQDAVGNNISAAENATVVARTLNSLEPNYKISQSISNMSSSSGLIRWCNAYSSKSQSEGVVFGIKVNANITYWTHTIVNVSSNGLPFNLVPLSVSAFAFSNGTLMPGTLPQKMNFSIEDAGGNALAGSSSVAVRVRIVPRLNSTPRWSAIARGRVLLGSSAFSSQACDSELPLEFTFIQSPGSSQLAAGPEFFCRAGVSDVIFDVGTYASGAFVLTVSSAFTMSVIVNVGDFKHAVLSTFDEHFAIQSYTLIDFLGVVFLDAGLNEVSGNATMSLRCTNSSVLVYPANPFSVISGTASRAYVPPFYVYATYWTSSEVQIKIGLTATNSSVLPYGTNVVILQLNRSCDPGYYVASNTPADLYTKLKLTSQLVNSSNVRVFPVLCERCLNGTVSSHFDALTCRPCSAGTIPNQWYNSCIPCVGNRYKSDNEGNLCKPCPPRSFASLLRDTCFTFDFAAPPSLVHPDKAFSVSGISIRDATGSANVSTLTSFKALIILAKRPFTELHAAVLSANATVNASGWTFPSLKLPIGLDPASDFIWALKLVEPAFTDVFVTLDNVAVSVLDVAPSVHAFSSSDISFSGSNFSVDCVPNAPSMAFFLPLFTVPNVTNASCIFEPVTTSLTAFSQSAHFSFISRSLITLRCLSLTSGQLGPPYSVWKLRVVFPDGRESPMSTKTVTVHCPSGMYIEQNATSTCNSPPCCIPCPSPMSTSVMVNSVGIQTCICQSGYYGSGGLSCKFCPRNAKYGFVCATRGLLMPLVKPGYYVDYALLSQCSEESCGAVVKCQNERACPGSGEKTCLTGENECYDNSAFGCVKCCKAFFMDNFVCRRCPSAQLPLLFGLALLALILFVGISSSIDFPPILSVVSGMKIFLKGMQAFVGIRLFEVSWPSIVLELFDFTRFFSFSLDVLRPECTFTYNEDTKLASILIGPFACVAFVAFMMVAYVAFKCRRISRALEHPPLQMLLGWNFSRTFKSVWMCIVVSSLCLKFTAERIMRHGILWNALNPALIERSDTTVLNQKVRRRAVAGNSAADITSYKKQDQLPGDWVTFRRAVSSCDFPDDFSRTTKRFRLMLSSAMSIFIFTFQGSMEAALSTFDCSEGMLRKVPTVQCNISDQLYVRLIVISVIGIIIYCVALPSSVALVLGSRWCRDVFMHENMAYNQLVGFLTSLYSKQYHLWELIICIIKVILISIPMFVSRNPIVQSLSTFIFMLIYMFFVLYLRPMQSSYLNKVEILSCVGVVIGSFTSVFFVVELNGSPLLSGPAKDLVGLVFVLICSVAFVLSVRYIYQNYSRLYIMYNISFAKSWILEISSHLGAAGTDGAYIPIVATLFNKTASSDVLRLKRKMRKDLSEVERHPHGRFGIFSRIWLSCWAWFYQRRLSFRARRYKPSPDLLDKCLKEPELDALIYLQKMSERVATWERVSWKYFNTDKHDLPAEFREVNGEADPPHAEYAHQSNVIHMLEDALPPKVHRVLTSLMFSRLMMMARTDLTSAERQYNARMEGKLQEFALRMSSISQMYFHILNTEYRKQKGLPVWRRMFSRTSKREIFMQALAKMSDLDLTKVTQDALGYSVTRVQPVEELPQEPVPLKNENADLIILQQKPCRALARSAHQSASSKGNKSNFSVADYEWDMTGVNERSFAPRAAHVLARINVPSHSQIVDQTVSVKTSGRRVRKYSKSSGGRHSDDISQTVESRAESVFELHEVVVHRTDVDCKTSKSATDRRANVLRGAVYEDVFCATRNAFITPDQQTTSLLASAERAKPGTRPPILDVRLLAQTKSVEALHSDGAVAQHIMPQPPPKVRSFSRMKQSSVSGANRDAADGEARKQPSSHRPLSPNSEHSGSKMEVMSSDLPQTNAVESASQHERLPGQRKSMNPVAHGVGLLDRSTARSKDYFSVLSKSTAAVETMGLPPPIDGNDTKIVKRREEKTATRAAQRQSSPDAVIPAVPPQHDVQSVQRKCPKSANLDNLSLPPPTDEKDAKLENRREEKTAARAARAKLGAAAMAQQPSV